MIGSHDTFTYLKSTSKFYEHFSRMWRTQCKDIREQYDFGVRFFDIRVHELTNGKWQVCHGIVNLPLVFDNLYQLCQIMKEEFPEAIYRIVLEKGSVEDESDFRTEAWNCALRYHRLWRADIKSHKKWMGEINNNNDYLFLGGYKFAKVNTWKAPAQELHGTLTVKNFFKVDLRKEAKINNEQLLSRFPLNVNISDLIADKEHLYFLDYSTFQYE